MPHWEKSWYGIFLIYTYGLLLCISDIKNFKMIDNYSLTITKLLLFFFGYHEQSICLEDSAWEFFKSKNIEQ